jgi:ActR/RegA family two-component response regulator
MTIKNKPKLIVLHHDAATARQIAQMAAPAFDALTTGDLKQAMAWLAADRAVAVLVTESTANAGGGLSVLEAARAQRPDVRRVLLTNYSNLAVIVQGLHSGAITRLVTEPLRRAEFLAAIALGEGESETAKAVRAG